MDNSQRKVHEADLWHPHMRMCVCMHTRIHTLPQPPYKHKENEFHSQFWRQRQQHGAYLGNAPRCISNHGDIWEQKKDPMTRQAG